MQRILLLLVLVCTSGCILMRPMAGEPSPADPLLSEEAIDSALLVTDALKTGQDELARRVLLRMRATHPDAGTLAWIEGVEMVLRGRAILASLEMSLAVVTDEGEAARTRSLVLRVRSQAGESLVLHMSPPLVRCRRSWIDPLGHGGQTEESVGLERLEQLELPADGELVVPILPLDGARGQVAAMRERWDFEMHFCYLEAGGERFPVNAPSVAPCERYLLADSLALGALGPEPLVELLRDQPGARIQQLVERAVRIPEAQMAATLDALAPVVAQLSLARVEAAAPILTWIAEGSGETYFEPGDALTVALEPTMVERLVVDGQLLSPRHLRSDPSAWKLWFERRQERQRIKPESPLDLPSLAGDASGPSQP